VSKGHVAQNAPAKNNFGGVVTGVAPGGQKNTMLFFCLCVPSSIFGLRGAIYTIFGSKNRIWGPDGKYPLQIM